MKTIYYNGNIITLEEPLIVESMVIEDGIITYLGDYKNIKNITGKKIDLNGKTIMPSFIDPHSHIAAFTSTLLIQSLDGVKNYQEIIDRLNNYKNTNNITEGKWIVGFGYDHNDMDEKEHPTKELLDKVSKDIPIMISHKSGHMGVVNSKALELLNIDKNSSIEGGTYGKDTNGELTGYLEEKAFMGVAKQSNNFSLEDLKKAYKKAEQIYLSYGITTAQDGLTKLPEFNLLNNLSKEKELNIDVISYIDIKDNENILKENKDLLEYRNNYKIGGYKLILDGSPQGKTAWMSKPYENEDNYCGYPAYTDVEVDKFVTTAINDKVQLLTHCNGDQASEQLIKTYEKHIGEYLRRPVMIHAQTVRKDQLDRMKSLDMIPSFFLAHVYYWGDIHLKNLGSRAYNISPVKWAIEDNLTYTFHQDTPVILPNMWETIWCSCNRLTKDGNQLEQKINILDAIKGVTINAAKSYFEEDKKGSLKIGKNADFIIIDKNPLKIDIKDLKDIQILETIKNGKVLYKKIEII